MDELKQWVWNVGRCENRTRPDAIPLPQINPHPTRGPKHAICRRAASSSLASAAQRANIPFRNQTIVPG